MFLLLPSCCSLLLFPVVVPCCCSLVVAPLLLILCCCIFRRDHMEISVVDMTKDGRGIPNPVATFTQAFQNYRMLIYNYCDDVCMLQIALWC